MILVLIIFCCSTIISIFYAVYRFFSQKSSPTPVTVRYSPNEEGQQGQLSFGSSERQEEQPPTYVEDFLARNPHLLLLPIHSIQFTGLNEEETAEDDLQSLQSYECPSCIGEEENVMEDQDFYYEVSEPPSYEEADYELGLPSFESLVDVPLQF